MADRRIGPHRRIGGSADRPASADRRIGGIRRIGGSADRRESADRRHPPDRRRSLAVIYR